MFNPLSRLWTRKEGKWFIFHGKSCLGFEFFLCSVTDWMEKKDKIFKSLLAGKNRKQKTNKKSLVKRKSFNYRKFLSTRRSIFIRLEPHDKAKDSRVVLVSYFCVCSSECLLWKHLLKLEENVCKFEMKYLNPENAFRFFKVFACLLCCCLPFSLLLNFHAIKTLVSSRADYVLLKFETLLGTFNLMAIVNNFNSSVCLAG